MVLCGDGSQVCDTLQQNLWPTGLHFIQVELVSSPVAAARSRQRPHRDNDSGDSAGVRADLVCPSGCHLQCVKYLSSSAGACSDEQTGGDGGAQRVADSVRHCTLGGLLTSCGYDGHSGSLWCIDTISSSRMDVGDVVTLLEESFECMASGTQMVGLLPSPGSEHPGDSQFWRNTFAENGMIVTSIDDAPAPADGGGDGLGRSFIVTGEKIWPSTVQEDRYRLHVENIEDDADEDYFDHVV